MINKSSSELESNLVRTDPADTKAIALKAVNGIVQALKRYRIVPKGAVELGGASGGVDDRYSGGDATMTPNTLTLETDEMISIEQRIDDLNYLVAPVTNGEVRSEINKIIEIFKYDPQLASIQDVQEYINLIGFDNLDGGRADSNYGGHDKIDGNSQTLRIRRDSAYNFQFHNPILMNEEQALELDTMRMKIGDGIHTYNELPYRHKSLVLQEKGDSLIDVMSQSAITRELAFLHDVYTCYKSVD